MSYRDVCSSRVDTLPKLYTTTVHSTTACEETTLEREKLSMQRLSATFVAQLNKAKTTALENIYAEQK